MKQLTSPVLIAWYSSTLGAIIVTNNQNSSLEAPDHYAAIAPMWFLLMALIVVVEVAFLPVTRSLFAAVLP